MQQKGKSSRFYTRCTVAIPIFVRDLVPQMCAERKGNKIGCGEDEWVWTIGNGGEYCMKETYNVL